MIFCSQFGGGAIFKQPVYNPRAGVIHGLLQYVSKRFLKMLRSSNDDENYGRRKQEAAKDVLFPVISKIRLSRKRNFTLAFSFADVRLVPSLLSSPKSRPK